MRSLARDGEGDSQTLDEAIVCPGLFVTQLCLRANCYTLPTGLYLWLLTQEIDARCPASHAGTLEVPRAGSPLCDVYRTSPFPKCLPPPSPETSEARAPALGPAAAPPSASWKACTACQGTNLTFSSSWLSSEGRKLAEESASPNHSRAGESAGGDMGCPCGRQSACQNPVAVETSVEVDCSSVPELVPSSIL
jgi:hypothetical protein